ncbi:MAG: LuxR C-terminal-related transcriptional regulator [Sulfitobacter sp.]
MLIKHAARLEKTTDAEALWNGVVETLATFGFDHAIYLTVDSEFQNPYLRCTLPEIYRDSPPQDDPFLRYACDSYEIKPIGTEFVDLHPYLEPAELAFIERAGVAGITAALALPMRLENRERFGGFIVGTGLDRATFMERVFPRREEVRLFCLLVHRRIDELVEQEASAPSEDFREPLLAPELPDVFDGLSPREREVIYLLSHGHSRRDAADLCGISVHTISDYAKAAYRKLGVTNRAQAAALIYQPRG